MREHCTVSVPIGIVRNTDRTLQRIPKRESGATGNEFFTTNCLWHKPLLLVIIMAMIDHMNLEIVLLACGRGGGKSWWI